MKAARGGQHRRPSSSRSALGVWMWQRGRQCEDGGKDNCKSKKLQKRFCLQNECEIDYFQSLIEIYNETGDVQKSKKVIPAFGGDANSLKAKVRWPSGIVSFTIVKICLLWFQEGGLFRGSDENPAVKQRFVNHVFCRIRREQNEARNAT